MPSLTFPSINDPMYRSETRRNTPSTPRQASQADPGHGRTIVRPQAPPPTQAIGTQAIGRSGRVAVQAAPQAPPPAPGMPFSEEAILFWNHQHGILDDPEAYETEASYLETFNFASQLFKDESQEFKDVASNELRKRRAETVQRQQAESAAAAARTVQAPLLEEPLGVFAPPPPQPAAATPRPAARLPPTNALNLQQVARSLDQVQPVVIPPPVAPRPPPAAPVNPFTAERQLDVVRHHVAAMTASEQVQRFETHLREARMDMFHDAALQLEREHAMRAELLQISKLTNMLLEFGNDTEQGFLDAHHGLKRSDSSYLLATNTAASTIPTFLPQIMRKYESGPEAVSMDAVLSRPSHIVPEAPVMNPGSADPSVQVAPQSQGIFNAVHRVNAIFSGSANQLTRAEVNYITKTFNAHFGFIANPDVDAMETDQLFGILSDTSLAARAASDTKARDLLTKYHNAMMDNKNQQFQAIKREIAKSRQQSTELLKLILNVSVYCMFKPCIMLAPLPDPISDYLLNDLPFVCRFAKGVSAMLSDKSNPATTKIHKRACVLIKVVHDLCRLNRLEGGFLLDSNRHYPVEPQVGEFMKLVTSMTNEGITQHKIRSLIEWMTSEFTCPVAFDVIDTLLSVPKDKSNPSSHHLSFIEASEVLKIFTTARTQLRMSLSSGPAASWTGKNPVTRKDFGFGDVKRPSRSLTAIHIGMRLIAKKRSNPPRLNQAFASTCEFGKEKHEEVDAYRTSRGLPVLPS